LLNTNRISHAMNKSINYILSILIIINITINASAQDKPLYDTLNKPQLISKQFSFTEGPAVDKAGNVFFTDQPNNKIWKYDTGGKLTVFMDNAGRSNGMYFDGKGNLITCADEHGEVWSISPAGKVTVLLKDFKGRQFNGPNDIWGDRKGGWYFTDPYYQRDYWKRTQPDLPGQYVYHLRKGSKQAIIADSLLNKPNGITGSPDGKYLYVADIGANKTYKYKINKDGSLSSKVLFTAQGSDGMTIDMNGNVYLTGKGVMVYNPQGKKIAQIPIPEEWTGNVCFAGKNRDVLFITASKAIYALKMNVKGIQ
jgi:gluconolactonase